MFSCQSALRAYVLCVITWSRANVPCVLTYSRASVPCVRRCSCFKRAILNNVNSYITQICYLYLGLKRGNIGETLVSLLEIFTSSTGAFRSLGGWTIFGEKNLGKCTMYIGIVVMPRFCCPVFHLHQFLTNATNTFG